MSSFPPLNGQKRKLKPHVDAEAYGGVPSPAGHGAGGSSAAAQRKEEEDPTEFLNHVSCHICNYPVMYALGQQERDFWMTSCGHIICNDPEHKLKKGKCAYCGTGTDEDPITVYGIAGNMPLDIAEWFAPPEEHLRVLGSRYSKIKFQITEMRRKLGLQEDTIKEKTSLIRKAKESIKHANHQAKVAEQRYKDLEIKYSELSNNFDVMQKECAEYRRREALRENPQQQDRAVTHPAPFNHVPIDGNMPHTALSPLPEEDEGNGMDVKPRSNGVYEPRLLKRHRVDELRGEYQGQRPHSQNGRRTPPIEPQRVPYGHYRSASTPIDQISDGGYYASAPFVSRPGSSLSHGQGQSLSQQRVLPGSRIPNSPQIRSNMDRYKFDGGLSAPQGSTSDPRWGQYEVKRPSSAAPLTFSTPQLIRQSHSHAQRPSGAASLHEVGGREGGGGSVSGYRDGNANGAAGPMRLADTERRRPGI